MADREMFVGDSYPELKGEVTDESLTDPVLDLSVAQELETICVGASAQFSGPATAIQPPEDDADGIHHWNWGYPFAPGDSDNADAYNVYLKVTWSPGNIETFGPVVLDVKPVA